jgi:broad specificity phosphatase PhoE
MPPDVELYLVRHAESEANLLRRFANGVEGYPLTLRGQDQAATLAARFSAAIAAVIGRAGSSLVTMAVVFAGTGLIMLPGLLAAHAHCRSRSPVSVY